MEPKEGTFKTPFEKGSSVHLKNQQTPDLQKFQSTPTLLQKKAKPSEIETLFLIPTPPLTPPTPPHAIPTTPPLSPDAMAVVLTTPPLRLESPEKDPGSSGSTVLPPTQLSAQSPTRGSQRTLSPPPLSSVSSPTRVDPLSPSLSFVSPIRGRHLSPLSPVSSPTRVDPLSPSLSFVSPTRGRHLSPFSSPTRDSHPRTKRKKRPQSTAASKSTRKFFNRLVELTGESRDDLSSLAEMKPSKPLVTFDLDEEWELEEEDEEKRKTEKQENTPPAPSESSLSLKLPHHQDEAPPKTPVEDQEESFLEENKDNDLEGRRTKVLELLDEHYGSLRFGSLHSFSLLKPPRTERNVERKGTSEIYKTTDPGKPTRKWAKQRMKGTKIGGSWIVGEPCPPQKKLNQTIEEEDGGNGEDDSKDEDGDGDSEPLHDESTNGDVDEDDSRTSSSLTEISPPPSPTQRPNQVVVLNRTKLIRDKRSLDSAISSPRRDLKTHKNSMQSKSEAQGMVKVVEVKAISSFCDIRKSRGDNEDESVFDKCQTSKSQRDEINSEGYLLSLPLTGAGGDQIKSRGDKKEKSLKRETKSQRAHSPVKKRATKPKKQVAEETSGPTPPVSVYCQTSPCENSPSASASASPSPSPSPSSFSSSPSSSPFSSSLQSPPTSPDRSPNSSLYVQSLSFDSKSVSESKPPPPLKSQVSTFGFYACEALSPKAKKKERKIQPKKSKTKKERDRNSSLQNENLDHWNTRYQACLHTLDSLTEGSPLDDRMSANSELMHLSEDFVYASHTVGKIIISEVYVPLEKKSIKPRSIGGRVGGEKYIVHNILFKFAIDSANLFCGSESAAAKTANHELKGLIIHASIGMQGIHFPLMALVDYRGFRLVAICVLPVDSSTLIYGTSDGGVTIHNKNKTLAKKMKLIGEKLNLKPHRCGAVKRKAKTLFSAADVEGHLGKDGKFYLLDFSRTMPPVRPDSRFLNGHLYQLFRREFVVNYEQPLCSDAYSGFIMHDRDQLVHNCEIGQATDYLFDCVIPKCARSCLETFKEKLTDYSFRVTQQLHRFGVNLRYIGKVMSCIETVECRSISTLPKEEQDSLREGTILELGIEAIARVAKGVLNQKLRKKMKELMLPLEVPYRKVAVNFLNVLFGRSKKSAEWWRTKLTDLLSILFSFSPEHLEPTKNWRQLVLFRASIGKPLLLGRLTDLSGLSLSANGQKKLKGLVRWNGEDPLDLIDLVSLGERVKHMDSISFSQGNFFLFKSASESDRSISMEMLLEAIDKFEESMGASGNKTTLRQCAIAWYRLMLLKPPNWKENFAGRANNCFKSLVKSNAVGAQNYAFYGRFLSENQLPDLAEHYFLRAMEIDPTDPTLALLYSNYLDENGFKPMADNILSNLVVSKPVIFPFAFSEASATLRVFFEDNTYRSVRIFSSSTANDVCFLAQAGLDSTPLLYMNLHRISFNQPIDTNTIRWGNLPKNVAELHRYDKTDQPWIEIQRPKSHFYLLIRKSLPPSPKKKPLISMIGPDIQESGTFIRDLCKTPRSIIPLLYISPLYQSRSTLFKVLRNEYPKQTRYILGQWLCHFPEDFQNNTFLVLSAGFQRDEVILLLKWLLGVISRAHSDITIIENHLQFFIQRITKARRAERRTALVRSKEIKDIKDERDYKDAKREWLESQETRELLDGKEWGEKKEEKGEKNERRGSQEERENGSRESRGSREGVEGLGMWDDFHVLAEQLWFWSFLFHYCLDLRDFLYSKPIFEAMEKHSNALTKWVTDSVQRIEDFEMFSNFVTLAHRSYEIGDYFSASALVEGLETEPIQILQSSWARSTYSHATARFLYYQSPIYQLFSPHLRMIDRPKSRQIEKKQKRILRDTWTLFEKLKGCTETLRTSTVASRLYQISKDFYVNPIQNRNIKKIVEEKSVDVGIVQELVGGPLKALHELTVFCLFERRQSFQRLEEQLVGQLKEVVGENVDLSVLPDEFPIITTTDEWRVMGHSKNLLISPSAPASTLASSQAALPHNLSFSVSPIPSSSLSLSPPLSFPSAVSNPPISARVAQKSNEPFETSKNTLSQSLRIWAKKKSQKEKRPTDLLSDEEDPSTISSISHIGNSEIGAPPDFFAPEPSQRTPSPSLSLSPSLSTPLHNPPLS